MPLDAKKPPRAPARARPKTPHAARPLAPKTSPPPQPRRSVLIVGSEAQPFAKTGGLADVLGALPSALARIGWDATVVLPRYRGVTGGTEVERFSINVGGYSGDAGFFEAPLADGARAVLVDCPELYDRDALYGVGSADYPDNPRRFAFLTRAALEFAARRSPAPSVVHAHDWQAGLAPVYLRTLYAAHPTLSAMPTVLTIHNLAYQGLFTPDWLPRLDLGWELFALDRLEYWGHVSFLKGGITAADLITTVSPRYAEEIQTPELGFGFDGILRARRGDLVGILNGIDTRDWDPANDRHLPRPYNAEDLAAKKDAKVALLQRFNIPVDEAAIRRPLIGMVSRMVDQKGFDLVAALAGDLPLLDATFMVLGTGEPHYQDMWTSLAARHPDRIGAFIGFDESLAHLIEGGADIFLMPSRFEPCGLNQMYSMRYGTVPVVHAVGGLADTVRDYAPVSRRGPRRENPTGFVFREYSPPALLEALMRALALYPDTRKWRALQVAGMQQDFSWDCSAREYVKIYERAIVMRAPVGASARDVP
jgi:starch synthase